MIAFRTRKVADMMDYIVGTLCIVLLSERVVIFTTDSYGCSHTIDA